VDLYTIYYGTMAILNDAGKKGEEMKYFKLIIGEGCKKDIVCHFKGDSDIPQYELKIGQSFSGNAKAFKFFYNKREGDLPTDYLANDMGWFIVSEGLKRMMELLSTHIEYFSVEIEEVTTLERIEGYYIANILQVFDALCLEESDYHKMEIESVGTIYNIRKYALYQRNIKNSDVFKLGNGEEIPIFVSGTFKELVESHQLTGMDFLEVKTV
jgi:hypothetical protein